MVQKKSNYSFHYFLCQMRHFKSFQLYSSKNKLVLFLTYLFPTDETVIFYCHKTTRNYCLK